MATLSPETRLVFRSADVTAAAEELQAISREVSDWERALRLAEAEAATASVWRALAPARDTLPTQVVEFLRTRTMMSDFRMQRLATRLAETLSEFQARGVDVLLLKGAAIGARVDSTFRTRPMTDLDLLVKPEALPEARAALLAAGWHQSDNPRFHALLAGAQHEAPFYDGALPGQRLELHTRILPPDHSFAVTEQELWDACSPAPAPFTAARLPSDLHLFFHLCAHFAWQHQMAFGSWRSIRAVSALLAQPGVALDAMVPQLQRSRAASSVYWTLRLANALSGIPASDDVRGHLRPPTPEWLARGIERSIIARIAPGEGQPTPSVRLEQWLWRAAIRPAWSGHSPPRRLQESNRWLVPEAGAEPSTAARIGQQGRNYRAWWRFVTQQLRS